MAAKKSKLELNYEKAYYAFQRKRDLRGINVELPLPPPITEVVNYKEASEKRRIFPWESFQDDVPELTIKREYERRANGLWFFNGPTDNIRLEYVTGYHYMLLQHFPVKRPDGDYGKALFVDAHRDAYYVWQFGVENSKTIAGLMLFSGRRFSKTTMACNIGWWKITGGKDRDMGIQSMTFDDAKKTVFQKGIIRSWKKMHPLWKPNDTGNVNPTESMMFQEPRKVKSGLKKTGAYLGGSIETFTAKNNAMDGREFTFIYHDEIGKSETGVNPEERYNVVKPTMFVGPRRRGTCMLTTTVDDMDKDAAKGTKKLWDNSAKISKKTLSTPTGLIRYFNPADYGFIGENPVTGEVFVDEWGYSHRDAARRYILDQRSELTGKDLMSYIRKYPLDEKEIFLSNADDSPFDVESITEQMSYNEDGASFIKRRGEFYREAGTGKHGDVLWRDKESGIWEIRLHPESGDSNKFRNIQGKNSQLEPTRARFRMGIDPYAKTDIVDKSRGSDGAALITDIHQRWIAKYVGRPPTIEMFAKQMIMAAQYYSCPCLIEDNKEYLVEKFKEMGYEGYIMYNPLETDLKKRFRKRGMSTTGTENRNELMEVLNSHIYDHIGLKSDGSMGDCVFQDVLQDWLDFDPNNWTPHDLTVAAMLSVAAWKSARLSAQTNQTSISLGFKKFSNKGRGVSKQIR